jgi:hypothetical protein
MNPETMNPTEMNHLTEAIVTAAKRVRKPKTPSIVEEIIRELRAGNYTEESLTTLARLFNREFVAEPVVEKKPRKSKKDAPVVTDGEAPAPAPKEKKPRKSKKDAPVVTDEEAPVLTDAPVVTDEEAPAPAPKEKKPRKSKKDAPVVTDEEAPPKDTPVVTEEEAPAPATKEKKPRKSKKDAPVVTEEEAPAPKEKKPRKSKKDAPVVTEEEAPVPSPEEKNATPLLEPEDELPNLELRLEGFLEEEELSDIELSDDEE